MPEDREGRADFDQWIALCDEWVGDEAEEVCGWIVDQVEVVAAEGFPQHAQDRGCSLYATSSTGSSAGRKTG